jgi:hypothetical protein
VFPDAHGDVKTLCIGCQFEKKKFIIISKSVSLAEADSAIIYLLGPIIILNFKPELKDFLSFFVFALLYQAVR